MARLFTLTWDNSRLNVKDKDLRYGKRECTGTRYDNGLVTLDNGAVYESMSELEHHLTVSGKYKVTFQDEKEEKAI